jgi:hypothetical protein
MPQPLPRGRFAMLASGCPDLSASERHEQGWMAG